ncbi:TPA: restriction endonuclease subunit S [Burkholderia orbicola]|uniref:restriction endonuclease subunit S n=1 Tax=Burkholderia cenocepacia TaxID=95486 RepID=UPI00222F4FAD|nr:restriction endonuclease subunit S [Burkholderia cenocepacia]MCW3663635.1 restriction endonuclease subunit S [Burkholderia cenocepacia]MDS0808195.1 restriction endonuclease subunit S [Burkholderia cenocepacia]
MEVRDVSAIDLRASERRATALNHTEVGPLPLDWRVKSLRECATHITDGEHLTPIRADAGYYLLSARNVLNGKLNLVDVDYVGDKEYSRIRKRCNPESGDILLSCSGTIGRVAIVPVGFECVLVRSVALIKPNEGALDGAYCQYFLQSLAGQVQIFSSLNQGAQPNLFLNHIEALKIAIPPTVVEQKAIAEALSDADALIESLSLLLVKKRQIKQGVMQQLLTGRKRLPGFRDHWPEKSLGELFQFSGGLSASRDQLSTSGHLYLHYGDIHTSTRSFIEVADQGSSMPRLDIPLGKVQPASLLADGDVVFVDASEDDDGVSKHVVVVNPDEAPFIAGLHTIVAKQKRKELSSTYLRYCFQTQAVKEQFKFYAVGTKVSGISKKNIAKITLPIPTCEEQSAIAELLVSIDTDIDALEMKLSKARELKQAMMQELLTGRIRLLQGSSNVDPLPVKPAADKPSFA